MTLGVSLNNPLNIRRTHDVWLGMDVSYTGPYCRFDGMEYCYRAGAIILRSYERRGVHTLGEAIPMWAPASDNNPTDQYLVNMCAWCQVGPDDGIELASLPVLRAMTRQESGDTASADIPDSLIELGLTLSNPQPET